MFRAYFDRSELGQPADVLAVSGYLSSDDHWRDFETEWHRALADFGVGTFHMTDFECRRGEFADWDQVRRTALLGRLIDLIGNHAFVAIGAAIVLADYNGLDAADRERLGHPYAMCATKAVADTLQWVDQRTERARASGEWEVTEKGKNVPVEFVFEEGDEGAGQLAEQLRKEQESGMFVGRIQWRFDGKGVAALQAADFAAYETTKQLVRTIGADERAMRRSLDVLLDKVPYEAEYFNSRSMGQILKGMGREEQRQQ